MVPAGPLRPGRPVLDERARDAASDPARDFVRAGLKGTRVHRFITGEYINGLDLPEALGLIAVSSNEVRDPPGRCRSPLRVGRSN
ncbi:hypothetical protein [Streptomyces antnestii]|uniref:hypothetical protein n=1 Tax=Streptomyces antnestii TaxID=2494256 RepID=UPI00167B3A85|nr:hypothetical protein [Streptomyces sp. San01]